MGGWTGEQMVAARGRQVRWRKRWRRWCILGKDGLAAAHILCMQSHWRRSLAQRMVVTLRQHWQADRGSAAAQAEREGRAGGGEVEHWEAVFEAQTALTARMGLGFDQQIESNLASVRLHLEREREQREVQELSEALAHGWGAVVQHNESRQRRRQRKRGGAEGGPAG